MKVFVVGTTALTRVYSSYSSCKTAYTVVRDRRMKIEEKEGKGGTTRRGKLVTHLRATERHLPYGITVLRATRHR